MLQGSQFRKRPQAIQANEGATMDIEASKIVQLGDIRDAYIRQKAAYGDFENLHVELRAP
jgi:hypothetical protein